MTNYNTYSHLSHVVQESYHQWLKFLYDILLNMWLQFCCDVTRHFRVASSLCFKTSLHTKPFIWKRGWFAWDSFWHRDQRGGTVTLATVAMSNNLLPHLSGFFSTVTFLLSDWHFSHLRNETEKIVNVTVLMNTRPKFSCTCSFAHIAKKNTKVLLVIQRNEIDSITWERMPNSLESFQFI